jgi:hypothetical protein
MLKDFPWLWAIRQQWYPPHTDITVLRADRWRWGRKPIPEKEEVWVVFSNGDLVCCQKADLREEMTLAQAAISCIAAGFWIEHVAWVQETKEELKIHIFCSPSRKIPLHRVIAEESKKTD